MLHRTLKSISNDERKMIVNPRKLYLGDGDGNDNTVIVIIVVVVLAVALAAGIVGLW